MSEGKSGEIPVQDWHRLAGERLFEIFQRMSVYLPKTLQMKQIEEKISVNLGQIIPAQKEPRMDFHVAVSDGAQRKAYQFFVSPGKGFQFIVTPALRTFEM